MVVVSGPQPNILNRNAASSLWNCESETGKHQNKNSTNPGCCLAATFGDMRGKFELAIFHNDTTAETYEITHTSKLKQRNDIESQTSPVRKTSHQNLETLRNSSEKMKQGANQSSASKTPDQSKRNARNG